jgi:protein LSM14
MPPPFGAPPGWFPPGQGFHQPPGPFSPNMPIGPPGLQNQNQNQPPQGARGPAPGPQAGKDEKGPVQQPKVAEADGAAAKPSQPRASAKASGPVPTPAGVLKQQPPPPPVDSKPDVAAALAPPHSQGTRQPAGGLKPTPSGPKGGRIVPAVPIPSPRAAKAAPQPQQPAAMPTQQPTAAQQQNATQLATAAVAEAMAKLNLQRGAQGQAQVHPLVQAPVSDPFNNLAQKVGEMRDQQSCQPQPRQRGTGEFRGRGGRGGRGGAHPQHPKMEVPTTDFDFESSNAKFNKQDLIKEAIASGSPLGDQSTAPTVEPSSTEKEEVVIPSGTMYDKSSFFDNISSELKDREEAAARGQEFRSQERHKNMETFGQGSVDGYRGRGRGRGGRGRGRGFGGYRGRGAPRGRGGAEFGAQPAA